MSRMDISQEGRLCLPLILHFAYPIPNAESNPMPYAENSKGEVSDQARQQLERRRDYLRSLREFPISFTLPLWSSLNGECFSQGTAILFLYARKQIRWHPHHFSSGSEKQQANDQDHYGIGASPRFRHVIRREGNEADRSRGALVCSIGGRDLRGHGPFCLERHIQGYS